MNKKEFVKYAFVKPVWEVGEKFAYLKFQGSELDEFVSISFLGIVFDGLRFLG